MNNSYLTKEEQYKEILNNEESERIEDIELREIRSKYWSLRHKAFVDEVHISDSELELLYGKLLKAEQEELANYRQRKGE